MDPWTIPVEMRAKYDAQFEIIQQGGVVTGDVARALFLKSGLPPPVLAKIWALADMDADGRIDKKEFSIALWLIAMRLKGVEVPNALPPSLLAPPPRPPPSYATDPFGSTGAPPPRPAPPAVPPAPVMSAAQPVAYAATGRAGGPPPVPPAPSNIPPPVPPAPSASVLAAAGPPPPVPPAPNMTSPPQRPGPPPVPPAPSAQATEWSVPQSTRLKFTQLFNQHDRTRTGFLNGNQARAIFFQTGLHNTILAQIWQLSDIDTDGRLTCEEFVLSMHLCEMVRNGQSLPQTLPLDLVPPSYRRRTSIRSDSVGSIGSHGSRGGAHVDLVSPPPESDPLAGMGQVTFEDKRRENYEKGQAELERRRQILLDQQRREMEERQRKEREEQARREKIRQEQERKRLEEIERERERQRQIELDKEAERKRQQEQKEAARREMERQRQLELQRQRISELGVEKQREQEKLSMLKRRKLDLCLQVERLSREVGEVNGKVAVAKEEVAVAKAFIDGMRPQRDTIMAELSQVKAELKEVSDQNLLLNQEKLTMQNQLASLNSKANNKKRELETKIEIVRKALQQLDNDLNNKRNEVDKAEKDVEEKENNKNKMNNVADDDVWGGAPKKQESVQEDPTKANWDDPTNVDWGEDTTTTSGPPARPEPPKSEGPVWTAFCTEAPTNWIHSSMNSSHDAWGDTGASADQGWGANDADQGWGDSGTASAGGGGAATRYRALYEFEARNEDELSFQPGDIINVTTGEAGEPGWLAGELRGKTGWFPEAYVEPFDGSASAADTMSSVAEVRSSAPLEPVTEEPASAGTDAATEGEKYYSIYPYESEEPGDLIFPANEIIYVTAKSGDWWTGTYNGASGVFPSNYVQPYEDDSAAQSAKAAAPAVAESVTPVPEDTNGRRSGTPNEMRKSTKKKMEIVTVIANYEASGEGQLTLVKGQFIQVRKKTDGGWWEGETQVKGKGRKCGWFPASYVKLLSGGAAGGNNSARNSPAPAKESSTASATTEVETPNNKSNIPANTQAEPEAAVPAESPVKSPVAESAKDAARDAETGGGEAEDLEGKEQVKALFAFQGQQDDELTFDQDEVIIITDKSDPAWWKGYKKGCASSTAGLFPSNYVEPLWEAGGEMSPFYEVPDLQTNESSKSPAVYEYIEDLSPLHLKSTSNNNGTIPSNIYSNLLAVDKMDLANNNELANIVDNFQEPTYQNLPDLPGSNRVSFTDSDNTSQHSLENGSSHNKNFSRSLSSQRFSPAKLTHINYEAILSDIHDSELNPNEKERQSCIYELISSEQSYVKDLMLVEKYFSRPMKKSGRVTMEDSCRMMVNWRELITCSDKILKAFKIRQKMSERGVIIMIGDIIVENVDHLRPYIRFCSRQSQAMTLIQQRTEQDPWFGEICKQFSRVPLTNGMPLTSYLLKPMQRITKYPLLVNKILKNTPENHPDHVQLKVASQKMDELCTQINEAVREVENSERLEWCQQRLTPPSSLPRIDFNSFTNILGPRKILYTGSLTKFKSNKELIAFLFNDFLLLTQVVGRDLGKMTNIFNNDKALNAQYRFYKEPFFMEKLRLEEPLDEHGDSFKLLTELTPSGGEQGSSEYILHLRANSNRERTGWISKIREAISEYQARQRANQVTSLAELQLAQSGCGRLLVSVQSAENLPKTTSETIDAYCVLSMASQTHQTAVVHNNPNPEWRATMQFIIKDPKQDVLCISVLQKQKFSPNEFLGRTEIRVSEILEKRMSTTGPLAVQNLKLLEVPSGSINLRVDMQLFQ